jgi:hypothetical protein
MANKDGGAHVDPELEEAYAAHVEAVARVSSPRRTPHVLMVRVGPPTPDLNRPSMSCATDTRTRPSIADVGRCDGRPHWEQRRARTTRNEADSGRGLQKAIRSSSA